jgi:hypothetical protein
MNNIKNIAKIIGSPESEQLEYKAVLPPARSLAQLIAAFANSDGGLIVLGVNDASGEVKITGLSEDFHANGVTHKAIDLLLPKPEVFYEYITQEGKRLYVIQVEKSLSTVAVENKIYIRKGNQNILSNPETKKVSASQLLLIKKLIIDLNNVRTNSTGSKSKFIDHYTGILNIIDDLSNLLYPTSATIPTTNQEGKILMRILLSSCADNLEIYLSDLLYEIYLANPSTLKSNQQVTIKEVLDCADIQEFVLYWAKKRLAKLQRGRYPTEQMHLLHNIRSNYFAFIMSEELSRPGTAAVRRSVTEKKRLLAEWQRSNLKMKAFCEQKEVSVNALKNWIKQFDIGRKRKSKTNQPGSFVALIPERSSSVIPFAEFSLPDNRKLTINHPVAASFLKELLSAST